MSRYGIKLVWAGWENDQLIGFNNRVKKKWEAQIGPGVKMLIYETSMKRPGYTGRGGIRSIIGEVEVTGTWEQGKGKVTPTQEHDNPLDVRVLRRRQDVIPIPLHRVRQIIGVETFPHQGQAWKPLTEAQYHALLAEWD